MERTWMYVVTFSAVLGLTNGVYEAGCRSFARCTGGVSTMVECPQHQVYNNATAACDDVANVLPPCGDLIDCQKEGDGLYPDLDQHCTTWYTCLNGKFLGHNFCPPGTVFDITLKTCNWKDAVNLPCGTYNQP